MSKGDTMNDINCELCKEPLYTDEALSVMVPTVGYQMMCDDCFKRLGVDGWKSVQRGNDNVRVNYLLAGGGW